MPARSRRLKILVAAGESVPFCKTGGLADVVGPLAERLARRGHAVRLVLPKYRAVDAEAFGLKRLPLRFPVPLGDVRETVGLWEGKIGRVPVYFVEAPKYFDRDPLYRDADGNDFSDNDDRFILFSRAVLETAKAVDFRPDIVHGHDWQTGLIPAYLKTVYRTDAYFLPTRSLFTIHNIAYQGLFPKNTLFTAGFSWADFTADRLEYFDRINFLKAGLVFADVVNTVSPAYAAELLAGGSVACGMEGVLRSRAKDFSGVLNGLDVDFWNPEADSALAAPFSARNAAGRARCKEDLQRACGFPTEPSAPLAGMVSRLDTQKGFDLLLPLVPELVESGVRLVFQGQGEDVHRQRLKALMEKYPGRVHYAAEFDERLCHKIYAGSDVFLAPSLFEPCGLGAMIALRYGSIPVVFPVGGLKDIVQPADGARKTGTGFVASEPTADALRRTLLDAIGLYREQPRVWAELRKRAMAASFGWERSVGEYERLYHESQAKKYYSDGIEQ